MKNYFLFILLTFFFPANSQNYLDNAKYLAIYELSHQPDSINTEIKKQENFRLYIGDRYSLFSSAGSVIKDSLMSNRDRSDRSMAAMTRLRQQIPKTEFNYTIYKGIPTGKMTYTEKIVKDAYRYTEDKNLFNWKIVPETKQISGYNAQKAITSFRGRNYTAWFTSEIPIPEGPYKFNGLPGLILRIADDKNHYSFALLEFKILRKPRNIDFELEKFKEISREQFLQAKKNYKRDPISAVEQSGITFKFEPGQREKMHQQHLQDIKNENNPLELE